MYLWKGIWDLGLHFLKLLLNVSFLLVGMRQGVIGPLAAFAGSGPALETGPVAQRAEGQRPASCRQEAAGVRPTVEVQIEAVSLMSPALAGGLFTTSATWEI